MSILKRGTDLVYAFRFLRIMSMKWEDTDAFKLGIIDANGDRIKSVPLDNNEKKSAYTPFVRLAMNSKKLIGKVPGGKNRLVSFAAALFLLKENIGMSDNQLRKVLDAVGVEETDFLMEGSEWFVGEDEKLSEGVYRLQYPKMVNSTYDDICRAKDQIRVDSNCLPRGHIFGVAVYEATHIKSNQKIFISNSEISK